MGEKVVIFGNTEMAEMAHFYLTHDSGCEVVAFTVDGEYLREETMFGLPVVPFGEVEKLYPPGEYRMLVAAFFGRVNKTRAEKYQEAKDKGYRLVSYLSSRAVTWPGLAIGENCLIFENTVIQPFTEIGNNVVLAPGTVVSHHTRVEDHCYLAPNVVLLGGVKVGPYCFLGANATIREGVSVLRESVVAAGVTITTDTKEKGVYVGKPAELLPKTSDVLGTWLTWHRR